MELDDVFVYCDMCGEKVFEPNNRNCVEEDGIIFCLGCYNKLLERENL